LKPFPALYISDNPYFMEKNLVIMGQVADAEERVDLILYQLETIGCLFNSTTLLLFESNSVDQTLLHLQRWSLRKPLDCSLLALRPDHRSKYGHLQSLEDVVAVFNAATEIDGEDGEEAVDSEWVNGLIVDHLTTHYAEIEEVDLFALSEHLAARMAAEGVPQIEIEQILFDKLEPIKFARYRQDIEGHHATMNKKIKSGDAVVAEELAVEEEVLRALQVIGSLNEAVLPNKVLAERMVESLRLSSDDDDDSVGSLQGGGGEIEAIFMDEFEGANRLDIEYAFLAGIKKAEMGRVKHSDFEDEFAAIHEEIEGLIQFDEGIIHEKLRERKRKYEERRRRERARKEREMAPGGEGSDGEGDEDNGGGDGDDDEEDDEEDDAESAEALGEEEEERATDGFRDRLFRIERFVIYRNMMLEEVRRLSEDTDIDYIVMADLDVYSIDVRTLMNEVFFMPRSVDGLCIDGIDWMGFTRDTFATVKLNGGWLHYGHDALTNNTPYVYDNDHAMAQRTKVPDHQRHRFEPVKSCFGGVMVYRNEGNRFLSQNCRYTLTRDIFFEKHNNTLQPVETEEDGEGAVVAAAAERVQPAFNYSLDWWLRERWHNEYSEQSQLEIKLMVKQYIELLQVFAVTVENKALIPRDGDICEHIPFHYCLWDKGFQFAISTRAVLYYDQFYPIDRNDTNWKKYHATRPKFTL